MTFYVVYYDLSFMYQKITQTYAIIFKCLLELIHYKEYDSRWQTWRMWAKMKKQQMLKDSQHSQH